MYLGANVINEKCVDCHLDDYYVCGNIDGQNELSQLKMYRRLMGKGKLIQGPGFESRWGCMFFALVVL